MKRLAILGSTGSIGTQTLDVIRAHPDRLKVGALVAHSNATKLLEQGQEFPQAKLALYDEPTAKQHQIPGGMNAILDIVQSSDIDWIVVSVAGVIGLLPTIKAIQANKQIALASKEVLVAAGEIVMPLIHEHQTLMTPIDSEHSAVFQCLLGSPEKSLQRIILTASGGPFRGKTLSDLQNITPQQALNHPTWAMGGKITIDSATLFNKGLETIEAKWLFDLPIDQVETVLHPQSIIHSMVEFTDGSVLAQMGWPNMRLPIQVALLHPDRPASGLKPWNPTETPNLTFESPDTNTFKGLRLARESSHIGGTMPCVMNAANEAAANAFLREECGFLQIADIVEDVMSEHETQPTTLENLLESDAWARRAVHNRLNKDTKSKSSHPSFPISY